jgi:hypothetical protein
MSGSLLNDTTAIHDTSCHTENANPYLTGILEGITCVIVR